MIRIGCWREQAVAICYVDKQDAPSQRTILPLAIMYLDRKLMVLAWCCLRGAFRMFDAGRISNAELARMGFRPRRVGLLRNHLALLRMEPDRPEPPAS